MKLEYENVSVEWSHSDGSWVLIKDTAPATDYPREAFLQGDEAEDFISYVRSVADGPFGKHQSLAQVAAYIGMDYLP